MEQHQQQLGSDISNATTSGKQSTHSTEDAGRKVLNDGERFPASDQL